MVSLSQTTRTREAGDDDVIGITIYLRHQNSYVTFPTPTLPKLNNPPPQLRSAYIGILMSVASTLYLGYTQPLFASGIMGLKTYTMRSPLVYISWDARQGRSERRLRALLLCLAVRCYLSFFCSFWFYLPSAVTVFFCLCYIYSFAHIRFRRREHQQQMQHPSRQQRNALPRKRTSDRFPFALRA